MSEAVSPIVHNWPSAEELVREALRDLRERQKAEPNRHVALAITKLEEALLWLGLDARHL